MDKTDADNVKSKHIDEVLAIAIETSFEIDPCNPILQEAFEYSIDNLTSKY